MSGPRTSSARGLSVDEAEPDRLLDITAGCGGTEVEFTPAP
ncbi:hypothetical protein [Streptomyces sp. NPDC051704]